LKQGHTETPGGQVYWSGDIWLNPDEEIQARFNYTAASDNLYLTIKTSQYPPEVSRGS